MLTGPDAAKAVDWIFTANMRKPLGPEASRSPTVLKKEGNFKNQRKRYWWKMTKLQGSDT